MTRFGVCGTAFWAENVHIPGLTANPEIELAGVWGRSPDRTAQLAEAHGLRAFATFDDLVDAVDAVSFAVPPAVQAELAPLAIRRGRHVLLEKPLGPTLDDAQGLVHAIADSGVAALCFLTRMFVGEMSAFVEQARAIAPTYGEAGFRSNALVEGPYSQSAWRQEEHGALWDAAPHGMSVLVSVLGPVAEVSASLSPDGTYAIVFRHAAGARSQLDLNLRDPSVKLAERYRFSGGETVELPGLAYDRKATFAHAAGLLLKEIGGERKESNSRLRLGLHLVAVATAAQESLRSGDAFIPVASTAPYRLPLPTGRKNVTRLHRQRRREAAPMTNPQPRAARLALGDRLVVHALFDGGLAGEIEHYRGLPPERIAELLTRAGAEIPPRPDLTCFLIEDGNRRLLVDAGAGHGLGPGAGALPGSLALIGLTPRDVDAVFLTHLHGDHVAGLTDGDGRACFPQAEIIMHSREFAFWIESRQGERTPRRLRRKAVIDRALGPYRDRIRVAEDGPLAEGVEVRLLPGHTPGHSGLMVGREGRPRLFIVGDILHLLEVQLPHPEVTTAYDWDAALAAETRNAALAEAEKDRLIIAGMHFRWPCFSRVSREGGRFVLAPAAGEADD